MAEGSGAESGMATSVDREAGRHVGLLGGMTLGGSGEGRGSLLWAGQYRTWKLGLYQGGQCPNERRKVRLREPRGRA